MPVRRRRRPRCLLVALALLVVPACGDDGGETDDAADEADFCRLALRSDPIDQASAPVLRQLEDLAPGELGDDVAVLRDLADELEGIAEDDPEGLALEFEVRFSEEYIEAREAVEDHVATACADERRTSSTTTSTSNDEGEEDG